MFVDVFGLGEFLVHADIEDSVQLCSSSQGSLSSYFESSEDRRIYPSSDWNEEHGSADATRRPTARFSNSTCTA